MLVPSSIIQGTAGAAWMSAAHRPWREYCTKVKQRSVCVCAGVPVCLAFVAKVQPQLKWIVHINKLFIVQAEGKGIYDLLHTHIQVLKSTLCATTMENSYTGWNQSSKNFRGGNLTLIVFLPHRKISPGHCPESEQWRGGRSILRGLGFGNAWGCDRGDNQIRDPGWIRPLQ